MPSFIVEPNPHIQISDADPLSLPLPCFHLVALVEPDPESWMVQPADSENFQAAIETHYDLIEEELFPETNIFWAAPPETPAPDFASDMKLLWVGGGSDELQPYYYAGIPDFLVKVTFGNDYEHYEDLRYYIQGVALQHPDWRVAVIGAMYEDDVMRVANAIQESGLSVTVLTHYCISSQGFLNLDALMKLRSELRKRGMWGNEMDDLLGQS